MLGARACPHEQASSQSQNTGDNGPQSGQAEWTGNWRPTLGPIGPCANTDIITTSLITVKMSRIALIIARATFFCRGASLCLGKSY